MLTLYGERCWCNHRSNQDSKYIYIFEFILMKVPKLKLHGERNANSTGIRWLLSTFLGLEAMCVLLGEHMEFS